MKFCRDRAAVRAGFFPAAIAAALLLAAAPLSRPASADQYPDATFPVYPDRGSHSFCFTPTFANTTALLNRARYSMDNNDGVEAQTVVATLEQSCGTATDVVFYVANYGGWYGRTDCVQYHLNGYCDKWTVEIDWNMIQQDATSDGYQARKTICHEIGHTLGLPHYSSGKSPDTNPKRDSCMISGIYDSGLAWTREYGPHHRGHVNGWFS